MSSNWCKNNYYYIIYNYYIYYVTLAHFIFFLRYSICIVGSLTKCYYFTTTNMLTLRFFFVAQCKQLNCSNTGKQRKTNIKLKHELKVFEKTKQNKGIPPIEIEIYKHLNYSTIYKVVKKRVKYEQHYYILHIIAFISCNRCKYCSFKLIFGPKFKYMKPISGNRAEQRRNYSSTSKY